MNYPTQPERLTMRTLAPDERRDCIERQFKNATAFVVSGKRLERPPKPMTWTDATPTEEGIYLFINSDGLMTGDPLRWAEMVSVEQVNTFGLSVEIDSARIAVSNLRGKWLRIRYDE